MLFWALSYTLPVPHLSVYFYKHMKLKGYRWEDSPAYSKILLQSWRLKQLHLKILLLLIFLIIVFQLIVLKLKKYTQW